MQISQNFKDFNIWDFMQRTYTDGSYLIMQKISKSYCIVIGKSFENIFFDNKYILWSEHRINWNDRRKILHNKKSI